MKMIIVDDEKLIREGLPHLLDWTAMGISIIATAADGAQALEIIRNECPDIVLSDICMPKLNGLELLEKIREWKYDIDVIFISAYSQFEHAQKAVRLGAFDYILKPIEETALHDVVSRCVKKRLDGSSHNFIQEQQIQEMINLVIRMDVLQAKSQEELQRYMKQYAGMLGLRLIEGDTQMWESITRILREHYWAIHEAKIDTNEYFAIVLYKKENWTTPAKIVELFSKEQRLPLPGKLAFSDCKAASEKFLRQCYDESSLAFLFAQEDPFFYSALKDACSGELEPEFPGSSDCLDSSKLRKYLMDLFRWIVGSQKIYDPIEVKLYLLDIVYQLKKNYYTSLPLAKQEIENAATTAKRAITSDKCLGLLFSAMCTYVEDILRERTCGREETSKLVRLALRYIHEHYSEDISLGSAAKALYISPSYLSVRFSSEVNCGFSKYLLLYRIEVGKKLLRDPQYKVYQVGEAVGYRDVSHFSKLFKQITGLTPIQYRNQCT